MPGTEGRRRHARPPDNPDFEGALATAPIEVLREVLRDMRGRLPRAERVRLEDALVRRVATARPSFRPSAPRPGLVDEARSFVAAALEEAYIEPAAVERLLSEAVGASLAGHPEVARGVYEALLEPLASLEIDLGQHEHLAEVLSLDLDACVAHYLAAVYRTAPPEARAAELGDASWAATDVAALDRPLAAMEAALGAPLPDLDAFLPAWIDALSRRPVLPDGEPAPHERWLQEALLRRGGLAALAAHARETRRDDDLRAWVDEVAARGDAGATLDAAREAATLAPTAEARAHALDDAARAARALEDPTLPTLLEEAWRAHPTLTRLSRWLVSPPTDPAAVRRRASGARETQPSDRSRSDALLSVLAGDLEEAARLLADAAPLGWARESHPGHLLFPTFAWLLGGGASGAVRNSVLRRLLSPMRSGSDRAVEAPTPAQQDALPSPTPVDVYQAAGLDGRPIPGAARGAMLAAMRAAAERRTRALLDGRHTRHYPHAAALVACCVDLDDAEAGARWVEALRAVWPAEASFEGELARALATRA